jgi:hypothetical protein
VVVPVIIAYFVHFQISHRQFKNYMLIITYVAAGVNNIQHKSDKNSRGTVTGVFMESTVIKGK